jgi:hypothetical protein
MDQLKGDPQKSTGVKKTWEEERKVRQKERRPKSRSRPQTNVTEHGHPMSTVDVGVLWLVETMDFVDAVLDVNIVVGTTESFGDFPHDSHLRTVCVLVVLCNQIHPMEVK